MKCPFPNLAAFTVLLLGLLAGSKTWADEPSNIGADEALQRLKDGNQRYATDKSTHERQQAERRADVAKGQKPFAIIVCCSDSRVSPEITFDQGLGDIFVVRTAGNVVDDVGLGSIEYAVEHLGPQLIVVVGHSGCGAVSAALSGGEVHGHVRAVVEAIKPAVEKAKGEPGNPLENAVRANVRDTVKRLKGADPVLANRVKAGNLKIVGGCYDLKTGLVKPVE
jgi:carbonic anhydrase